MIFSFEPKFGWNFILKVRPWDCRYKNASDNFTRKELKLSSYEE